MFGKNIVANYWSNGRSLIIFQRTPGADTVDTHTVNNLKAAYIWKTFRTLNK
jgi:hypothetical protein